MDTGWTFVSMATIEEMKEFVEGPIESFELPFGIHISSNFNAVLTANYKTFSTAIVEEDGDAQPLFGNVFLASRDQEGNPIPLNQRQLDWLSSHARLVQSPSAQLVMKINPFISYEKTAPMLHSGDLRGEN